PLPSLTAVLAALPDAVDTAMRRTLGSEYSPERARAFARTMRAELIRECQPAQATTVRAGDSDPAMDEALRRVREGARR
ncbi:hypothetical protein, partial [Streptomyces sp. NPDC003483]